MKKHRNETRPALDILRQRVRYDAETGELRWSDDPGHEGFACEAGYSRWMGKFAGNLVGKRSRGYVVVTITVDGREIHCMGHRVAWALHTGNWPDGEIDHRDGERGNNRFTNLREASHQQNQWNKGRMNTNRSGFKGVHKHAQNGNWIAQIRVAGSTKHLGCFDTAEKASHAYQQASLKHHQSFARIEK